jgi:hypothetical protein
MPVTTDIIYPDGSSFTSTLLSKSQMETLFQTITAQMMGLMVIPLNLNLAITADHSDAVADSMRRLYIGLSITGQGIADNTFIAGLTLDIVSVFLSNPATESGTIVATVVDLDIYSKVRIGWQTQGQPGVTVDQDEAFIRCEPIDTEFSKLRDALLQEVGLDISSTDVYTRAWKTTWTFYGPNSLINAKLVQSGLLSIPFIDSTLADSNLYVNPSISEPRRCPEFFQGQWWERVDMEVEFNEQVTEVFTVGTVGSVQVNVFDKEGQLTTVTVTE